MQCCEILSLIEGTTPPVHIAGIDTAYQQHEPINSPSLLSGDTSGSEAQWSTGSTATRPYGGTALAIVKADEFR